MPDRLPAKKKKVGEQGGKWMQVPCQRNTAARQAAEASCKLKALSYRQYILSVQPATTLNVPEPRPAGDFVRSSESMAAMGKIAKTADRKKVMDTTKSTDCPKCGKATRIVKRVKDRERGVPGGIYISCSACEFFEKL
jgi:DNA-directed RNA polymerase subunit M/transcription elongation factor TFIIS